MAAGVRLGAPTKRLLCCSNGAAGKAMAPRSTAAPCRQYWDSRLIIVARVSLTTCLHAFRALAFGTAPTTTTTTTTISMVISIILIAVVI